ncbi:hypothetical protein GF420_01895 [candidate division GN15 bacterium]|nr:hypothetical protein [candidate division GN15 bacterium]
MKSSVNEKTTSKTDTRSATIVRIREAFENAGRILVVSHLDPDGDALGSQLAIGAYLRDLGKSVTMVRDSEIPEKYRFLPGVEGIVEVSSLPDDFAVDAAVVLECPTLARVGSAARYLTDSVKIINIDHHPDALDLGAINWIETTMSSVGEMVYEFFEAVDYDMNSAVATSLYTAIMTDTGRFRYPSTTRRTMEIAGALIEAGADPHHVCDMVYYNMRPSTLNLTGQILHGVEFHFDNRVCLLTMTREMLKSAGAQSSESEGMVDYTLYSRGVVAGALLKEVSDRCTKVSLRARDGVNVAQVAHEFGGGGHFSAAGCQIDLPLAEAKAALLDLLRKAVDERG